MYRFGLLLLLFIPTDTTTAFRPPNVAQELGCSPTLSLLFGSNNNAVFFDPLGLANDVNFSRYREAELKHGRVAMLAVAATMVVPFTKGLLIDEKYPSGILPFFQHFLSQSSSAAWADVARVLLTCGLLESFILVPREATALPGDYGTGYFGIRDKGWNEENLVIEIEHGRLAMLAFVAQLLAEVRTGGKSWDEQWLEFFKDWVRHVLQL